MAIFSTGRLHPLLPLLAPAMLAACASPPPAAPVAPAVPTPVAAPPRERPIDTSPVPEPPGLVAIGRVKSSDAVLETVANWTKLPIPNGRELVRSLTDDSVAEVVDLRQPVDVAVSVGLSRRGVDPLFAFAVAVPAYDQAKTRLGQNHRLVPGTNGELKIVGIGKTPRETGERGHEGEKDNGDDDGDEDEGCTLAPAATGGRIVCGSPPALVALLPYLTRTMPREKWTSDLHIELHPEPVRGPLMEFRTKLPFLAHSMIGNSPPAVGELIDAALGEGLDIVNDAQKLSIDAQIADSGVVSTTRFEFRSNKSTFAKLLTSTDRADQPPAAFWHLPAETDTAFYGRGSDPKLFEHARSLLTNVMIEAADGSGMPPAERQTLRDLVADRMLPLFVSGAGVYGKGFDQPALEKAMKAKAAVKEGDVQAEFEAEHNVITQVIGWHLYQVAEPIAKVGPMFKDLSALWNRPAFAKWAKAKTSGGTLPAVRIAAAPAGVTLPKDSVHLEVSIPIDDDAALPKPPPPPPQGGRKPPPPPKPAKKIPHKPVVVHFFAVPDGSATWLGFGLDAKLVAQKAAASLASAPDTNTIGKDQVFAPLREGKANTAGMFTMRGVAVLLAAGNESKSRDPFALLASLPHQGKAPVFFGGHAEPPSGAATAGSSVGSLRVSRAVIEDFVKLGMQLR